MVDEHREVESSCVSIIVVLASLRPSESWIVRMSYPASSRRAANEWRSDGQVGGLEMPAAQAVDGGFGVARRRPGRCVVSG